MKRFVHLVVLFVIVVAGCSPFGGDTPTTPNPDTPAVINAPEGGTITVRLAEDVGPLKPWAPANRGEEQIIGLIYRGLTQLDAQLAPQPSLATHWTSDVSGRTLTMTLRTDVTWHDGQPVTAADAAWTLTTLSDISPTTTLLSDMQRVLVDAQVPTSNTLVLSLKEPYAPLLSALSMPILPQHIFGSRPPEQIEATDFWLEPIGSGPFQFEERQPGQSVALVRNRQDAIQVPFVDRIAFLVAPDPDVVRTAMIDTTLMAAEVPWPTARTLSTTEALKERLAFGAYPENGFYGLVFNVREGHPFSDNRVRQALALALDGSLIKEAAGESAVLIGSDHLPGMWASVATAPPAEPNLSQASELLDQAGWVLPEGAAVRESNGITLSAVLYVRGDDERRVQVAERVAQAGRTIGIDLSVAPSDFESAFLPRLAPPFDFEVALVGWTNSRVRGDGPSYAAYDPDNFALFHSSQIYQGPADGRPGLRNIGGFNNSSYDNLSAAARALYDTERRRDLYRQIDELLITERPYIFLWADQIPVLVNPSIKSVQGPLVLNTPNWLNAAPYWYIEQ